jgi:hypothetical protein
MPTPLDITAYDYPCRIALGIVSGMVIRIPTADEIDGMTATDHKVAENRARRMAERQGLRLDKCRRRDKRAVDFGTYRLVKGKRVYASEGGPGSYGLSLADVFSILTDGEADA